MVVNKITTYTDINAIIKTVNNLEKEFVPYQESLELKALGFDEPCFGFYERDKELVIQECETADFHFDSLKCITPTFSQAFRWFREKYELVGYISPSFDSTKIGHYTYQWLIKLKERVFIKDGDFNTCEEAELACLRKLIEIVKNKN